MDPLTIMAIVGTGISLYSALSSASEREEAAQRNLALSNQAADEMEARAAINEELNREDMRTMINSQGSLAAARGGGASAGIGNSIEIHRIMTKNMELTRRDVEFKVKMMRLGAQFQMQAEEQAAGAMRVGGFTSAINQGVQTGLSMKKYSKSNTTTELPKMSSNDYVYSGPVASNPFSPTTRWAYGR